MQKIVSIKFICIPFYAETPKEKGRERGRELVEWQWKSVKTTPVKYIYTFVCVQIAAANLAKSAANKICKT